MIASNNNRIAIFFILTLSFSVALFYLPQLFGIVVNVPITQLAPAIIALLLWNMYDDKDDFVTIIKKRILWINKPDKFTIIVILIPIIIVPLTVLLNQGTIIFNSISLSFVFWAILGAFTEEVGWRGYLQYRLGLKTNILLSSLFSGVFWVGCQFNMLLNFSMFLNILLFILLVSFSLILTFLFYKSNRNMFWCFVFHAIHNILAGIFIASLITNIDFLFLLALLYLAAAIVVVYLNRTIFQLNQW